MMLAPALVAAALLTPAHATDVEELRRRAQSVADRVSDLERKRVALTDKRRKLEREIETASSEIGLRELEMRKMDEAIAEAQDRFVERAVEAYKSGSTANLELILSARTVTDMITVAEARGASALADTDALSELSSARTLSEDAQSDLEERKSRLLRAQIQVAELEEEIGGALRDRRNALGILTQQVTALEKQARRAAERAAQQTSIPVSDALLDLLAPSGPSNGIPDGFVGTGVTIEGIASWYGPGFEGNLTASGDVFDSSLFTAASKELPLGTWLYVEYKGKGVVVLVNDRGPYVGGRILDLSRGAAQAIGMEHAGIGWVTAEIVLEN